MHADRCRLDAAAERQAPVRIAERQPCASRQTRNRHSASTIGDLDEACVRTMTRPVNVPRPGANRMFSRYTARTPGENAVVCDAITSTPSFGRFIATASASHRLGRRFDQRVSSTVCRSNGRAADDLEHVGGRGLLLQRFTQLVKQSRVLDRDDGLACEVLDQLDLLVGERSNLLAKDIDDAD